MGHNNLHIPARWRVGGVISTKILGTFGYQRVDRRSLVNAGELIPLRHGWYAMQHAHPLAVRAVRAGGVLGCASALRFYGSWRLLDDRLHVHFSNWGRRQPARPTLASSMPQPFVMCPSPGKVAAPTIGVVPVELAVRQARLCLPSEDLLVLVESLVRDHMLFPHQLPGLLGDLVHKIDASDSGTETMVRLRLRGRGIRVRPQVQIAGVGRVDFLIGDRLVLEIDSHEHHRSAAAYHADRRRDQRLLSEGYLVMRITWEQVMFGWAEVEQSILQLVRSGRHRAPRTLNS